MPAGVDERQWKRAKRLAQKQGMGLNYSYIMGIYKNLVRQNPWLDAPLSSGGG